MQDLVRELIDRSRRSGDRVGVDGASSASAQLAAETIRLARVATSIHLADSARRLAGTGHRMDLVTAREPAS